MGLNPFHKWWKVSSYVKWYYYPIGMPLIALFLGSAWVVITIFDFFTRRK